MRGLIRRAAVATSAAVVLLGLTAGVASAGGTAVLSWSPTTSPGTYNFGTANAGQKVSQTFTLTNSGKVSGTLTVTLAGSSAFTRTADTCTGISLGTKKSCRVTVQYGPTAPGQTDSATLTANGKTGTAGLTLAGASTKASPALATSPSAGGSVGSTTVTDTTALSNGVNPTGTIEFKAYGPSATANCATTPVDDETVTVAGNGSYTTPAGFTPTQAGTYWWTASYGGDPSNNPTSSGCGAESVTIAKASPAIATSPGEGGPVGSTAVTDTASLGGSYNAAGTIEFTLYGPSATANCATASVFNKAVTVNGDGTYTTPSFTPAQAGTYYWVASYGGDTNNNPATTTCGDEPVVITKASPVIATSPSSRTPVGASVTDTATLTGGYNPTGMITFNLYGPSPAPACSAPVFTGTEPVSAGTATSVPFSPAQAGTYWWIASYDGDTNNNPAATNCGDESVIITPPSHLYWANHFGQGGGTVNEADLDGGNPRAIVTGNEPFGVAVDISHIYWADMLTGTINEANLDGSNPHAIVSGQNQPAAVAMDSSHIYWTNFGTSTINEANLDGTGVTILLSGQNNAFGLAVDTSHIYWTCDCSSGAINEANLDGGNPHAIVSGLNSPYGVAVDSSRIYWTSIGGTGTINEANLDGSNPHAIVTGQGQPTGVAVDRGHVYWANGVNNTGTISKANLDGTGVTTLATGQQTPRGVAVGPQ